MNVMMTRHLPKIRPENDETFRPIVSAYLAKAYDEWICLQAKENAEIIGARDRRVVLVEVRTDEFTGYRDLVGCKRDFAGLRVFADTRVKGDAYRSPAIARRCRRGGASVVPPSA